MNETMLEIVKVVLGDAFLRERVLGELDITDEAAREALSEYGDGKITTRVGGFNDTPFAEIFIKGMGLCGSEGDDSAVYLEFYEGKWVLRVWADINQEDPTHSIDLSGALRSSRACDA